MLPSAIAINAEPAIADFSLRTIDGFDSTAFILHQNKKYILLFAKDFSNINEWKKDFEDLLAVATSKNVPVYIITADADNGIKLFKNVPLLKCDATVIKTAARVNPTYFVMQDAAVLNKLSYADTRLLLQEIANTKWPSSDFYHVFYSLLFF